ncbi:MAG: PH domain-containing protein [Chloroflexota bacterium]|nr:PH domain-containing protein [Chloroflexota bacterium]
MRYADTLLADGEVVILRTRQHWLALLVEGRAALVLLLLGLLLIGAVWVLNLDPIYSQWLGIAALVALGIGLLVLAIQYWQWWAQDYIVTNRRLLRVTGVINKRASSSSLEKINDAVLNQNLLGRMLNFGDVDILTASGELAVDYFRMVNGAKEFKRVLTNQKHALEMEYRYTQAPSPALRASGMDMNGQQAVRPMPAPAQPMLATEPASSTPPPPPANHSNPPDAGPPPSEVSPPPAAARPADSHDAALEITQTLSRLADLRDRGAISAEEYEAKKDDLLRRL